jgi:glucokinase
MHPLLVGDIGATYTRLALFSAERGAKQAIMKERYLNSGYSGLEEVVQEFLAKIVTPIKGAVFAVAGPVLGGKVSMTNLLWELDEESLAASLSIESVHLINDLVAIASAIPKLADEDFHDLNTGAAEPNAPVAVIACGTGLGEAFLSWDGNRFIANQSEGGHVEFGPLNDLQVDLLSYLLEQFEHVSYERVCSGIGIQNLYEFMRDRAHMVEPTWLTEKLKGSQDPTALIVEAALDGDDPPEICTETLNLFIDILGAEAGNLALKVLSTGGVYITGGIPPRILSKLDERFMQAFSSKGRFSDLMGRMPVSVILDPEVALMGATLVGLELLENN